MSLMLQQNLVFRIVSSPPPPLRQGDGTMVPAPVTHK